MNKRQIRKLIRKLEKEFTESSITIQHEEILYPSKKLESRYGLYISNSFGVNGTHCWTYHQTIPELVSHIETLLQQVQTPPSA